MSRGLSWRHVVVMARVNNTGASDLLFVRGVVLVKSGMRL